MNTEQIICKVAEMMAKGVNKTVAILTVRDYTNLTLKELTELVRGL